MFRCGYHSHSSTGSSHGARPMRSGFTLVDLTLTLMILGIVTAAAAPRLSSSVLRYQVDAAARRVEADINYVQATARFTSATCSITFSSGPPGYTTTGVKQTNNSNEQYTVNLNTLGYSVSLTPNINGNANLTYLPDGSPRATLGLAALNTATIVLSKGNQTRTVTIDPVTGRARRS